jgi:hypothetical protein
VPRFLCAAVAVALAASLAAPAPRLKDPPVTSYFPTTVGARWVYETESGEETEVVTKVTKDGSATVVSVGLVRPGGEVTPTQTVAVRSDGLFLLTESGHAYNPPVCLLKLPVKPGGRWEDVTTRRDIGKLRFVQEVKETKELVTPGGTYEAVRIESTLTLGDGPSKTADNYWYAPGVGLIQIDKNRTLKSFEQGKK